MKKALEKASLLDRDHGDQIHPGNLPAATGARAPVILGSITPGRTLPRLPLPEA